MLIQPAGPNDDVSQLFKWYFSGDVEILIQEGRMVLLGAGTRLFERLGIEPIDLEIASVVDAPGVTHLTFRVVR